MEDAEIQARFWAGLRDDRTVMLGLEGDWAEPPRPMTAVMDPPTRGGPDHGPVWFFTARETALADGVMLEDGSDRGGSVTGFFTFASKGHDVFATVQGGLVVDMDRAVIDRLWSPFIAAWYEGGKDDPNLLLLRFDPARAEIWLNGSSLMAGLKMLLGGDPREDARDKVSKGPI